MKIGLVGFPGSGKTSVFNALTGLSAETGYGAAKPGTKNLGSVKVPEPRLHALAALYDPRKTTLAEVMFSDIAGGGAARGLDRSVLNSMREMDALAQVLRAFDNPAVSEADDPVRELGDLQTEMILADLEILEKRRDRLRKERDSNPREVALFERLGEILEAERPLRDAELDRDERLLVSPYQFLSLKPLMLVLNVPEDHAAEPTPPELQKATERAGLNVVVLSAAVEMDIAHMDPEDRVEFTEALGLDEPASDRFIRGAFQLLDLITMFTVGPDECRSWPVPRNSTAPRAAGKIHSDLERGFIRAEVIDHSDLLELGSEAKCRDAGKLRVEGRDYIVQDGNVVNIRFNV